MLVLNPQKLGPALTQKKKHIHLWVLLPDCAPQMLMLVINQRAAVLNTGWSVLTIISPTVLQFLKKCNTTTWTRGEECEGRPTGYAAIWVVLQNCVTGDSQRRKTVSPCKGSFAFCLLIDKYVSFITHAAC